MTNPNKNVNFERLPQSAEECLRAALGAAVQESGTPDLPQGGQLQLSHLPVFFIESQTVGDKEGVQGCPKAKVQVCAQTSLPLPAQGEVQLCAEAAVPVGAHPELLCSAKAALRGRAAGGVPPGAPRAVPQGAAAALRDSCSAAL